MKPFAILLLSDLTIMRFDSRDEVEIAANTLFKNGKSFIAFRWHPDCQLYSTLEPA